MNIKTVGNTYFLDKENTTKIVKMIKDWLNLDPIKVTKSDDNVVQSAIFLMGGMNIMFMSKSDEKTNSAMKVGGGTSAINLIVETKEDVEDLYKKAVDLGFTILKEPFELEASNSYLTSLQDEFKNYWHVVTSL